MKGLEKKEKEIGQKRGYNGKGKKDGIWDKTEKRRNEGMFTKGDAKK